MKEGDLEYLSADDIAYELNPEDPLSVPLEAGKLFYRRLYEFAEAEKNIIIESTLSGKTLLDIIKRFQDELVYTVSIVFIFLDSKEICIETHLSEHFYKHL